MKKVLSSLVVLAILVGMFVCMGVQAFAAEGDVAVYAVSGQTVIDAGAFGAIQNESPNALVVDVDGVNNDGSTAVYTTDPATPADTVTAGQAVKYTVGQDGFEVIIVGVAAETDVAAAIAAVAPGENPYVIAVGPQEAASVVAASADVDMFMTWGLDEAGEQTLASSVGEARAVNVGRQAESPVCRVVINVDDFAATDVAVIPVPAAEVAAEATTEPTPEVSTEADDFTQPTTYKVTYSGNGNDEGTWMPDPEVQAGTEYALAENGYTKAGYTFAGWDVNSEIKQPGESITVNSDVQVTATWTENAQAETIPSAGMSQPMGYVVTYKPGVEGLQEQSGMAQPEQQLTLPGCFEGWTYEGHKFDGWKVENGDDTLYTEGSSYPAEGVVTGEVTFVAQWSEDTSSSPMQEASPEAGSPGIAQPVMPAPAASSYTVTYSDGNGATQADDQQYQKDAAVTLKDGSIFTAPEGMYFTGWLDQDNVPYGAGAGYTMPEKNVTFTAQWANKPVVSFNANGGTGEMASVTWDMNGTFTVPNCSFTREGYNFASWQMGEQSYQPGGTFTVTENVTLTANWTEIPTAEPGHVDTLMWTTGGTDPLYFTYNIPIATISMDGSLLAENTHYVLSNGGKTAQLLNSYLDTLTAGDHKIDVTFTSASGDVAVASDKVETITISVKAPDPIQTAEPSTTPASNVKEVTWADRTKDLSVDFTSAPQKLYINYGSNGLKEATLNTDYTVSGQYLTLKPDMVNKNRGVWNNGLYGFVVTLADGSNVTLKVTLAGTAPAASTATPVGGNSPVTGDTNNIVLYVVLLAVLVLALAVVLIVMVKRRKGGHR